MKRKIAQIYKRPLALLALGAAMTTTGALNARPVQAAPTTAREMADIQSPTMISVLQRLLRARGFHVVVDGKWGAQTRREVANFQRSRRLKANGVLNDATWRALVMHLERGDRGQAVRALQELLRATETNAEHPVRAGVDGVFGAKTEQSVRFFQKNSSLTVDGVVGPTTWNVLLNVVRGLWFD